MSSISFEPLISPAVWIALALPAAVLLVVYARSRPGAISRRRWRFVVALTAVGLAALLGVLLNPTWLEPIPPPAGKPLLTVLVDRSASMGVKDAEGSTSRFANANDLVSHAVAKLEQRFDVQVRSFAEAWTPASLTELAAAQPEGKVSDISGALAGALTADRPQGQAVLLVSDGIHNAPGGLSGLSEVLRTSKALDAPVYTITVGGDTVLRDLEIGLARPQDLSFVGQNVPVSVIVKQRGRLADRAEVSLLQDGREVAQAAVPLTANGAATHTFHVSEKQQGLYRYEVRLQSLAAEATPANNSATFLLRVIEEPVRVLLLEGKPYWDAKFLVRTLAADPSVELDAIVRVTETRFAKRSLRWVRSGMIGDAAVDGDEKNATPSAAGETSRRVETTTMLSDLGSLSEGGEDLSNYQLLVLGRDAEAYLTDSLLERLRTWISRDGGSLVCYRGAPVATVNQNLARLLPVRWAPARETRFRVQLTERGQELNWLGDGADEDAFSKLPSLSSVSTPEKPKPLSVVLARGQQEPGPAVVTYQPYGTGRVVVVEGAGMWRWAFLAPQFQQHDQVYSALWQSLLRWLVSGVGLIPGQDLLLRTDKVTYTSGDQVTALLLMRNASENQGVPAVQLFGSGAEPMGTFTPIPLGDEPGVYRVPFGVLPEGSYRAAAARSAGAVPASTALGGMAKAGDSAAFDVRAFSGEQLDVQSRPDVMTRIAKESGGAVLQATSADQLAEQFQQHLARSRPERVRRLTAWDRWWVLLGIVAAWGGAWGLRRASGLV